MQQHFPTRTGHQIDDADMNVRKNLGGIDTRFAGTRHQVPDCLAEIGHVIVGAQHGSIDGRTPRQAAITVAGDDRTSPDVLPQDAANDAMGCLVNGGAPVVNRATGDVVLIDAARVHARCRNNNATLVD